MVNLGAEEKMGDASHVSGMSPTATHHKKPKSVLLLQAAQEPKVAH